LGGEQPKKEIGEKEDVSPDYVTKQKGQGKGDGKVSCRKILNSHALGGVEGMVKGRVEPRRRSPAKIRPTVGR